MPYKIVDPPHVGQVLKRELAELGVKIAPLARALGVGQVGLHRVLAGERALTPEMALRIEAALGIDAELLSGMQHEWDMAQARKHQDEIVASVKKLDIAA